jgi:hypothetical protein
VTDQERRAATLAKYAKYNRSRKGSERYKRYEDKHPERAGRWGPLMKLRASDPLKGT